MIIRYVFVLLVIFTVGCETKREREKRLKNEEVRIQGELDQAKSEYKRYKEQKNHIVYATAKERFAYLYSLKQYNGIKLEHYDYLKKIEVIEKSTNNYKIVATMFSERDLKINFHLFLHDEKGLIVGQYHCYSSWPFRGKLKKQQSLEKIFSIKTSSTPSYFQIALVY